MQVLNGLLQVLVKGFFLIITKTFDILLAPFVAIITALIPDISTLTTDMFLFLNNYIVPYIKFVMSCFMNLFHVPMFVITILFTYYAFLFIGKHTMVAVNFAINLYNKLKP